MSLLLPIFQLVRPLNLLITFLSILGATALAGAEWGQIDVILLAGLTGAFVAAGANAINDYFDVEIDKVNRPERPIPRGALSQAQAFVVWAMASAVGLICGWFTGYYPFLIALAAVILLYGYSRWLKSTALLGNLLVGFMTGLAFIFGAVAVGSPEAGIMPAVFALLVNVAREVVKDIEDREGDRSSGATTLPLKYGVRPARALISVALSFLIVATIAAYLQGMYDETYLGIVVAADVFLAYVAMGVWKSEEPVHMRNMSNLLKVAMVFGLAALYFGRTP